MYFFVGILEKKRFFLLIKLLNWFLEETLLLKSFSFYHYGKSSISKSFQLGKKSFLGLTKLSNREKELFVLKFPYALFKLIFGIIITIERLLLLPLWQKVVFQKAFTYSQSFQIEIINTIEKLLILSSFLANSNWHKNVRLNSFIPKPARFLKETVIRKYFKFLHWKL